MYTVSGGTNSVYSTAHCLLLCRPNSSPANSVYIWRWKYEQSWHGPSWYDDDRTTRMKCFPLRLMKNVRRIPRMMHRSPLQLMHISMYVYQWEAAVLSNWEWNSMHAFSCITLYMVILSLISYLYIFLNFIYTQVHIHTYAHTNTQPKTERFLQCFRY